MYSSSKDASQGVRPQTQSEKGFHLKDYLPFIKPSVKVRDSVLTSRIPGKKRWSPVVSDALFPGTSFFRKKSPIVKTRQVQRSEI